jgi:membrane-associated PAP2 superfamily phosphatase
MFIAMLLTACEDQTVNERLEKLLSFPNGKRQATVHSWVRDLLIAQAPKDFVAAIACLLDDKVAEKAYEVIYKCKRDERF